jgi:hypothetical protein
LTSQYSFNAVNMIVPVQKNPVQRNFCLTAHLAPRVSIFCFIDDLCITYGYIGSNSVLLLLSFFVVLLFVAWHGPRRL